MKNRFIISVFAAVAMTAAADTAIPTYFTENWSKTPEESGWENIGSGKTPAGATADLIDSDAWHLVEFPFGEAYMSSTGTTAEGGKVNASLISPAIEIPLTGAVLSFEVANWNPDKSLDNRLLVYVVATDQATDYADSEPVFARRIKANNYAAPEHVGIPLNNFEGTTVRLVFVNEGNDCGLLGLGKVSVAMYDADILDHSAIYRNIDSTWRPEVSVGAAACFNKFIGELVIDGEVTETIAVEIEPEDGFRTYSIPFKTELTEESQATHHYSVTLQPENEEFPGLKSKGTVVFGGGYPGKVVEEEGTGEQCGNCPYGAAGLERFSALYPERFFGIAIHCTDQFSGTVMRAPGYSLEFEKNPANPIVSLPSALLNRTVIVNPSNIPEIEKEVSELLGKETALNVHILRADYDQTTAEVDVRFAVSSCADLEGVDLTAAAVLTADNLKGSGSEWTQTNYLSGQKRPAGVDDSWWEYLKFYFEYPSKHISSGDYKFDHVAMGIYPDFNGDGMVLPSTMTAGNVSEHTITFTMPMQKEANGFGVQDAGQTSVTVMIFNHRTGEILTAARVDADNFNRDLTAIEEIADINSTEHETIFYDLTGRRVDPIHCQPGIYIRSNGLESRKIIINN